MKKDFELIKEEIREKVKTNLVSVILFGSAVKSAKGANDYDVLIITKKYPKKDFSLAWKIRYDLLGKISKPLDIFFYEKKDLNYPSPILYELNKRSKLLWGKDVSKKLEETTKYIFPIIKGRKKIGWQIAK